MSEEWPNLSAEDEETIDQLCTNGAAAWSMKSWVNTLNRELQSARAIEAASPDTRLREAIDYAAEAAHHRYWDSNFQDGHTGPDWRECSAWPCLDIFAVAALLEENP